MQSTFPVRIPSCLLHHQLANRTGPVLLLFVLGASFLSATICARLHNQTTKEEKSSNSSKKHQSVNLPNARSVVLFGHHLANGTGPVLLLYWAHHLRPRYEPARMTKLPKEERVAIH
jgi:hypothetical protein